MLYNSGPGPENFQIRVLSRKIPNKMFGNDSKVTGSGPHKNRGPGSGLGPKIANEKSPGSGQP